MDINNTSQETLTEQDIKRRLEWLQFDASDEDVIVNTVRHLLLIRVETVMDTVYKHFLAFPETRKFFPDDATLKRAKDGQTEYFRRLTQGNYDVEYAKDRMKVGAVHARIKLDHKWYLGAYCQVLAEVLPIVVKQYPNDPARLTKAIMALLKLIFFDISLALEGFTNSQGPNPRH